MDKSAVWAGSGCMAVFPISGSRLISSPGRRLETRKPAVLVNPLMKQCGTLIRILALKRGNESSIVHQRDGRTRILSEGDDLFTGVTRDQYAASSVPPSLALLYKSSLVTHATVKEEAQEEGSRERGTFLRRSVSRGTLSL